MMTLIQTLHAILQPLLERFIHIDRIAYANDHGSEVECCDVFDSNESPRNVALILCNVR